MIGYYDGNIVKSTMSPSSIKWCPASRTSSKVISCKIFGKSKIDETAAELGVPVLAKLPINPEINVLVDEGRISEIEANELDDFVELLK